MRKIIGFIIFAVIQLLFIPLAIIGVSITYYKQMYVSKRLGVSQTAIEILNGRWTMDRFGLRKDPSTVKLFNVLPNTSGLGLWLALFPLYILKQIAGTPLLYPTIKRDGNESLANLVTSRTVYNGDLIPGKKRSLEQLKMTNEELEFGIAFEGNNSEELKSLIESENMKLGKVHYMGYRTKKGTWMAVTEIMV